MEKFGIGQPVRRKEDDRLLRGQGSGLRMWALGCRDLAVIGPNGRLLSESETGGGYGSRQP
jgi:hypothetical protein